jgi:D-lactate dehydrogenase (cytochrome)
MALPAAAESGDPAARDTTIASLHDLLGDRLSSAAPVREQHGKDASYHPQAKPKLRS